MISFVGASWQSKFQQLIDSARSSLTLCSPYVGDYPCKLIAGSGRLQTIRAELELYVLTDLSRDNLLAGSTDPGALAVLADSFPRAKFRFLPSLHAKVYIADDSAAIVTSANMTFSGIRRNYEFGVKIEDPAHVQQIRASVLEYGEVGSNITGAQLKELAEMTRSARLAQAAAEAAVQQIVADDRIARLDSQLGLLRTGGERLNTVFERAIPFILRQGPKTTPELHESIRAIHPDLCDDTQDRVIAGQHFGKKWKHAVRSAQWHLKARGIIELKNGRWQIIVPTLTGIPMA